MIDVLKPWYGIVKYIKKILISLPKNNSLSDTNLNVVFPSKAEQKISFQVLYYFKKQKNIDNQLVTKKAQIVFLPDQGYIIWIKTTPTI